MDHLSSCYLCGVSHDEPLGTAVVEGPDGAVSVTLCSSCRHKLDQIFDATGAGETRSVGRSSPSATTEVVGLDPDKTDEKAQIEQPESTQERIEQEPDGTATEEIEGGETVDLEALKDAADPVSSEDFGEGFEETEDVESEGFDETEDEEGEAFGEAGDEGNETFGEEGDEGGDAFEETEDDETGIAKELMEDEETTATESVFDQVDEHDGGETEEGDNRTSNGNGDGTEELTDDQEFESDANGADVDEVESPEDGAVEEDSATAGIDPTILRADEIATGEREIDEIIDIDSNHENSDAENDSGERPAADPTDSASAKDETMGEGATAEEDPLGEGEQAEPDDPDPLDTPIRDEEREEEKDGGFDFDRDAEADHAVNADAGNGHADGDDDHGGESDDDGEADDNGEADDDGDLQSQMEPDIPEEFGRSSGETASEGTDGMGTEPEGSEFPDEAATEAEETEIGSAQDPVDDKDRNTIDENGEAETGASDAEEFDAEESDAKETDAEESDTDEKTAERKQRRQSISALEYNKVMRLLQNREFPVDREEIETVAANAYDLSPSDCAAVIDLAIDRELLAESEGELYRSD